MSDQGNIDEREALAAEYALGVLGTADRAAAAALLARDSDFAAAVARWTSQLAPLVETLAPLPPSSGVWDRISAEVAPPVRRAPIAAAASQSPASFWSSLFVWRGMSFASTAAATALAFVALSPDQAPVLTSAPQQTARADVSAPLLLGDGNATMVAAAYDPNVREVLVTPAANVDIPAGRTMELWIIIGDKAPRSLGVITPGAAAAHVLPGDVRADLASGATLAISIEPLGGSRTGAPTGPVVAAGKLTAV